MKTKSMIICSIFAAVLCIFCIITVPIGPVPVTMATFAVMLTAITLDTKLSVISVIVYILLGAVGLPVFSGMKGGAQVLFGPTGGYIWSFIFMALIISTVSQKRPKSKLAIFVSCIIGIAVCYLLGTIQFVFVQDMPFAAAFSVCVLPFIPFDIIKAVLALYLGTTLKKRLSQIKFLK